MKALVYGGKKFPVNTAMAKLKEELEAYGIKNIEVQHYENVTHLTPNAKVRSQTTVTITLSPQGEEIMPDKEVLQQILKKVSALPIMLNVELICMQ